MRHPELALLRSIVAFCESSALFISSEDGSIHLRGFDEPLFKNTPKASVIIAFGPLIHGSVDHRNGYEWLQLRNFSFGGLPCDFALCFHAGKLCEMSFGVSISAPELIGGRPTRASSEREVEFIRKQLKTQMNRPFASGLEQFEWGSMWSVFDERGQQASSGL